MCHEAKKFVEHVKKMHKEGERGFEEEFKVNKITIIILIIYNYYIYNIYLIIITLTEMCVQTQVLCSRNVIVANKFCCI